MAATDKGYKVKRITLDSDSFKVSINLGASYCISNSTQDFEGEIILISNSVVDGIATGLKVVGRGTIKWKVEDDNEQIHMIYIPNSLYVPSLQ